ncbi:MULTISPECIES: biotin attachment protein [unclassified Mesorhizobium]|uniref:biotin attachment protein n=1 Tax=unclassified Mesorhizobium TaxID=325217 RepID=UPI001125E3F3|nr:MULTISPECIES: biotin attachment protein [unclassified Mesorhizobium]TPL01015.1 biotin attachment protein [Mesorhizobium sp. B2-4-16]TPL78035.1 biotin attachment protein [Mesorhizobium sp. B2-4-3]
MTADEIERLAAWCAAAGVSEIELAEAGFSLCLRIQSAGPGTRAAASEAPKAEVVATTVRAPGVGVFRLVHPTTGHPVIERGQTVRKGETVGVLQIGACLKAVVSPADGKLGVALAEDGAVVGYGTPLYELL